MNPKADMYTLGSRRDAWALVRARHRVQEGGSVLFGIHLTVGRANEKDLVCLVSEINDRTLKSIEKYVGSDGRLDIYTWEKSEMDVILAHWKDIKADVEVHQLPRTLH